MNPLGPTYRADDRLRDLIDSNNHLLLVMTRFGIPLGFGDATVGEACQGSGVSASTFLAVANHLTGRTWRLENVSLDSLMSYLENAHEYFLDFVLPMIRRKLTEALEAGGRSDVAQLIMKFFDGYVAEVHRHMEFENDTVFVYARKLIAGTTPDRKLTDNYSDTHESMVESLEELKDIIVRHYTQQGNDLLTNVLYDIMNCERDLMAHCKVEDEMFIPALRRMEAGGEQPHDNEVPRREEGKAEPANALSQREGEIVACVAQGMSNKEIADKLCLSVHTVTTHRRNISSKLQIHSPAGLAIYAIIHHLVDFDTLAKSVI